MIRVRFAPSPTGYLHLGNIRTALFNYLFVKRQGGKFVLRVEDTDRERSKPEFRQALMEDMLWMGIRWDEGPEVGGEFGPYLQSERLAIYQKYLDQLIEQGKAYYCYVTEEETEELKRLAKLERRPPRFDNRGRNFSKEEIESRKARGIKPTVRFKIENPQLKMHDLIRGDVSFNLDEMVGDFVIQRADGQPTFHLAVCVDDGLMQITHVIRGEDHLSNTPKHILLLQAMGFTPPEYGHLSLIHGPGGEPLSKRLGDVSVKEFRRKGYLPHGLANYIALLGWAPGDNREIFKWEELMQAFDLARVNKSASIYDPHKLDWVNGEHLRALSDEDFSRYALAYLKEQKLIKHDETILHKVLPIFKDNIERFDQLAAKLEILAEDFSYEKPEVVQNAEAREIFEAGLSVLAASPAGLDYDNFVNAIKPKVKAKGKNLFMPLRLALTGKEHGPELKRLFPVFGIEGVKKRLERALKGT
ncbi:MAG: glutamate--tRNA ligase [Candidatus Omnitrophica bacterium]|nr:glutamate--tRNA ligase [Candidatus Omnitrophota bacterium]